MAQEKGKLSINSENFLPIIKKWLYTDKDIFVRELVSNGCDAVTKFKKLVSLGEAEAGENEKYAVTVGGGSNHRYNLSDGVMLKDNHIGAAGGVKEAIAAAKAYAPFVRKIEVETETLDMVREAVEAGADIIMLDNMSPAEMAEAIRIIDGRAETECSGNMTIENIKTITALGVDYVSSGALTHSAPILDISLKNLHAVE